MNKITKQTVKLKEMGIFPGPINGKRISKWSKKACLVWFGKEGIKHEIEATRDGVAIRVSGYDIKRDGVIDCGVNVKEGRDLEGLLDCMLMASGCDLDDLPK